MEDPRWARSRAALLAAMTESLDQGVVPSISDVVAAAGVSRPTFYQHFGDVATACTTAAVERVRAQFTAVDSPSATGPSGASLDRLLTHLHEHRTFYTTVFDASDTGELTEHLVRFIADRIVRTSPALPSTTPTNAATADQVTALAAGLVWLVIQWLKGESSPAPIMAARIRAVMAAFLDSPRTVAR